MTSQSLKTGIKLVESTQSKNGNSSKESNEKVQSTVSMDVKSLRKRKLSSEGSEGDCKKKKVFSVNDRLIEIKNEQLKRLGKDRNVGKQNDKNENDKISLEGNKLEYFKNDEQSKLKLLKEKYNSKHTVLNQEVNISKGEINKNEFSLNSINNCESRKKRKLFVNERLSKCRQELMLKHHPIGIISVLSTSQKEKRFSVNDRLQKLREKLQAKDRTVQNTYTTTSFSGRNIKSSLFSSKYNTDKIQNYDNKNSKTAIQTDKKFSVNDELKGSQEKLKSQKYSAIGNNSKTVLENENIHAGNESTEAMEIDGVILNETAKEKFTDLENTSMDWEYIGLEIDKNIEEIRCQPYEGKDQTLSEHYDVVGKNLLKLFAETNKLTDTYEDNKYYFVIDTNIFLKDLHFLDELNDCDTDKIVLIVPYVVLQELDSLKIRISQAVSTLAVRAIKYLNDKFETKKSNIRGQSAIEAENHIITINSADDCVINCCLQIKAKTQHVALLTHDINLKNKARSSAIKCVSKEDFEDLQII